MSILYVNVACYQSQDTDLTVIPLTSMGCSSIISVSSPASWSMSSPLEPV